MLDQPWARHKHWTALFIAIGVMLRLFRFSIALPLNGDECALGLNIINRAGSGFLRPLDYMQVAPIGFLLSQHLVYRFLGMSEYAMRLLPTLAGIAGLIIFSFWAKLLLKPLPALIATAIISVGLFVVQHGVELKPYGFDFLASVTILFLATDFLIRQSANSLVALCALTPFLAAMSYPSLFVAGSAIIALASVFLKQRRAHQLLIVSYGIVLLASFFAGWLVTSGQYQASNALMSIYWKDAFPPANPLRLFAWLITAHTGPMFAYPIGGKNFLSLPSFVLFAVGLFAFAKSRPSPLLALLIGPFLLTLFAAVLHRYPYGQSERVCQHLVPSIAILIAVGVAFLIEKFSRNENQKRLAAQLCIGVFFLLSLYVLVLNVIHPGTAQQFAARNLVREMFQKAGPGAVIAVIPPRIDAPVNVQWYLRRYDEQIIWSALEDRSWTSSPGRVCVMTSYSIPNLPAILQQLIGRKPANIQQWTIEPFGPPDHWQAYYFPPKP